MNHKASWTGLKHIASKLTQTTTSGLSAIAPPIVFGLTAGVCLVFSVTMVMVLILSICISIDIGIGVIEKVFSIEIVPVERAR